MMFKKVSDQRAQGMYREFKAAWKKAKKAFDGVEREKSYKAERLAKTKLIPLINRGKKLSEFVLEHKDIPDRHTKDLEMATRAFLKVRRRPYKPKTWLQKKERRIRFLLKTQDFPKKQSGSSQLFEIGPFEVHNTVKAGGRELELVKDMVKKASRFIEKSGVPAATDILYGKIFLTGRLQQAHTNAWYDTNKDTISILIRKKVGPEQLQALIHEFGHRLWNVFLDKDKQRQWRRWHTRMEVDVPDMPLPEEGDPLGFSLKGDDNPVVQRVEGSRYYISDDGYLTIDQIYDAYNREYSFPTPYSKTDKEEHFCEAFALYCMDTLESRHEEVFERVIVRGEELE